MTSEDPPFVAGPEERALSPAEADILAASLLGELRTRLGGLQIAHARRVADAVRDAGGDDGTYAAALLHDVVEKGCITGAQLLSTTRDAEVVRLVGLLTQEPDEVYEDYLVRCSQDADAVVIKRADLIDKFDPGDSTVSADGPRRSGRALRSALSCWNLSLLDRHRDLVPLLGGDQVVGVLSVRTEIDLNPVHPSGERT